MDHVPYDLTYFGTMIPRSTYRLVRFSQSIPFFIEIKTIEQLETFQISRAPGMLWFLGNIGYQGQDAIFDSWKLCKSWDNYHLHLERLVGIFVGLATSLFTLLVHVDDNSLSWLREQWLIQGVLMGKKKHVEELLGTAGGEVFNQKDWQIQPTKWTTFKTTVCGWFLINIYIYIHIWVIILLNRLGLS